MQPVDFSKIQRERFILQWKPEEISNFRFRENTFSAVYFLFTHPPGANNNYER
jgi:hypothetical protein